MSQKRLFAARDRVLNGKKIGLHDLNCLLTDIATPKADSQTQQLLVQVSEKISSQTYDQSYQSLANSIIKDKHELIQHWQDDHMPNTAHSINIQDAAKKIVVSLDRESMLKLIQCVEQDVANSRKELGHKLGKKHNDDRSRGGRSR